MRFHTHKKKGENALFDVIDYLEKGILKVNIFISTTKKKLRC